MTMLLYHLVAERLRDWRAQRKVAREIDALLRGCGFVERARGVGKAKAPSNLPAEGDRVRWRRRQVEGRLTYVNTQNNWCRVTWETADAPKVCHLYDLEKIDASTGSSTGWTR